MVSKKPPANEVDRAVAGITRAMNKLIDLLKSLDEEVRAGADAALRTIDPPPTRTHGVTPGRPSTTTREGSSTPIR